MMAEVQYLVTALFALFVCTGIGVHSEGEAVWGYQCKNDRCVKTAISEESYPAANAISLPACRLFCGEGAGLLWPQPTGQLAVENELAHIDPDQVWFQWDEKLSQLVGLWEANRDRFRSQLKKRAQGAALKPGGKAVRIKLNVTDGSLALNYETDESYSLTVGAGSSKDELQATIEAKTFFGARHGLETLSQLVLYDDIRNELQMVARARVSDAPAFPHRGLALDTSRNFIDLESLRRTIDGMAMVKLNVFHWHITDSQSFPLVVKSRPTLHTYGAYSRRDVYTADDVQRLVQYALERGIRIVPELDAPAHVGEGWEKLGVTACFNYQPWENYCVEPPCGQLDPTKDAVYDILEDVYREMNAMFNRSDLFHMGGDEVSVRCWNATGSIQRWMGEQEWGLQEGDFMKLWNYFQTEALRRLDKTLPVAEGPGGGKPRPIVMWTSKLTESPYLEQYLDKDRYIVQVWTTGNDSKVANLLQKGYRLIMSNYDALYLDCGFAGWVTDGSNWCAPYIGWQKVYNNDLMAIGGPYAQQILGGEAALWTEQSDTHTLDNRLWPRLSAHAERLWSNPRAGWQMAEARMLLHRERLIEEGIAANSIQPKWCLQNEANCPIGGDGGRS
ncbi:chitooligosaccharidolytic beta-N-acetylglucosaminidase [Anopheles merus]|uniref:beta-N-acetylhexosaminidase n=1 Tax=Anopheles merus TaxID=30066 RepID=A0A182VK01_ANOME|nr:chitooligosaccharidolytic beta-N-acetylglucosaminidase [Anopheles merus]XP_041772728.1 chitooligosaccharidolytic beta-N-acetylglucosaminidase [Anopheles merus]XP_041772729.1 chitooligosaccharidolytic beta-N-acetylglucosaminidase [Anopheles merus]